MTSSRIQNALLLIRPDECAALARRAFPVGRRSLTFCTKREVSRMQDSPVSQTHESLTCAFCQIIRSQEKAYIVFEDGISLAFLDSRPLFPGHCLLVPKDHYETLADLPASLVGPLFQNAQLLERAIEEGLGDDGTFVAINSRVRQSIPYVHIPLVPLNEEAARAIQEVQALRRQLAVERGFPDRLTGIETRYLFVRHGKLLSVEYLFQWALQAACAQVGLVDSKGKATITAHRFRHTVGKQLAEKGAKLHTIMTVLGHASPHMTMVYAQISDPVVRQDYQAVLGPGATIAGPSAEALRAGKLSSADIQWLQDNFFKTELELGRCLRLPQEGPCECELYLTCAKFVTTSAYAPRLRRRRRIEQELVEDAAAHGWQREVERHQCTIRRLEQLLTDLGESIEGPEATDS